MRAAHLFHGRIELSALKPLDDLGFLRLLDLFESHQ